MDKRQDRTLSKIKAIKRAALELFTSHGVDKVSVDEIAAKAHVSKVTLYKYFGTKEALYAEVLNLFVDETLAATETVLNSDQNFLEKLKSLLRLQADAFQWINADELFKLWEGEMAENIQTKVKSLVYRFYEEGKNNGYIDETLSFDMLYLYSEIFRAGFKSKSIDSLLTDQKVLDQLYDLYFFGFIKRK